MPIRSRPSGCIRDSNPAMAIEFLAHVRDNFVIPGAGTLAAPAIDELNEHPPRK